MYMYVAVDLSEIQWDRPAVGRKDKPKHPLIVEVNWKSLDYLAPLLKSLHTRPDTPTPKWIFSYS